MNNDEAMYIDDISSKYRNGDYDNKMESPYSLRKYREDYVFDEDQSVKWNREEVIRKNKKVQDKKDTYKAESSRLQNQLNDDIIKAIMFEYGFNEEQAQIINGHAYDKHHSSGYYEILNCLNEICDIFQRFEKAGKG